MGAADKAAALEELKSLADEGSLKKALRALQRENLQLRRDAVVPIIAPSGEPRDHLVIGDPHSDPLWDNGRFRLLGKIIEDLQPAVTICMGDFATLGSLGRYDRGKLHGEGQRLTRDIEHATEALWLINEGRGGTPTELVMLEGNHENRVPSYVEDRPELAGTYSTDSLGFTDAGWNLVPFLTEQPIDGVTYCHYLSTSTGRAVASRTNLAHNILNRTHKSYVVAHCHLLSYYMDEAAHQFAAAAGCFFEHDERYAAPAQNREWARGLVRLRGVVNGYPTGGFEFLPMGELQRRYGG